MIFGARAGLRALTVLAFTVTLAACGGGGGGTHLPPATPGTPVGSAGPTIASLGDAILAPATTQHVNVLNPAAVASVDLDDRATVAARPVAAADALARSMTGFAAHSMPTSALATGSASRASRDVALNSPLDLTYQGGAVLGSAISDDIFVNCDEPCREANGLRPGRFLEDLANDTFIEIVYQYLASPGTRIALPLTGRYTKGDGADASFTPGPSNTVAGFTNPVLSTADLIGILAQGIVATGGVDTQHNRIYHLFLPKNYDTCLSPTSCYSPDRPSTFRFCAYHGWALLGNAPTYFTVEPYADVAGCRPLTNLPLPNQLPDGTALTDSTDRNLAHELIETITDPQLNAWYNVNLTGNEIGDNCFAFNNFVTLSGRPYVIHSEYSDIGHVCVSPELTDPNLRLTPG